MKSRKELENRQKLLSSMREQAKSALGTPVRDRFWVEEVRPAYNTGGYYDVDVAEKVVEYSRFFETLEEALSHLEEHVPSVEGNFLRVRKQTLYERTTQSWSPAFAIPRSSRTGEVVSG